MLPSRQELTSRYVLLVDLKTTPLAPLAEALLLSRLEETLVVWQQLGLERLVLKDLVKNQISNYD
jgi:hypothetical protein